PGAGAPSARAAPALAAESAGRLTRRVPAAGQATSGAAVTRTPSSPSGGAEPGGIGATVTPSTSGGVGGCHSPGSGLAVAGVAPSSDATSAEHSTTTKPRRARPRQDKRPTCGAKAKADAARPESSQRWNSPKVIISRPLTE